MHPKNGVAVKADGTTLVDTAEKIESLEAKIDAIHAALVTNGNAKVQLNGSISTPAHTQVSVPSGASTVVLAANANRKYALICNISDANVFLRLGSSSGNAGHGIFLAANGGNYEISAANGNLITQALYVLQSSGANKLINVLEAV